MKLIGSTVGKTRSGAKILFDGTIGAEIPSPDDWFDGWCVFDYLAFRELRRMGESSNFASFLELSWSFKKRLTAAEFEKIRLCLNLRDAFVIRDFARALVNPEFR